MIEKNTQKVLQYKPGDVVTLTVARLGEMGAFLRKQHNGGCNFYSSF